MNIIQKSFYKLFPEKDKCNGWNKFKDKLPKKGDYIILEGHYDENEKKYLTGYIERDQINFVNIVAIYNVNHLYAEIELYSYTDENKYKREEREFVKRYLQIYKVNPLYAEMDPYPYINESHYTDEDKYKRENESAKRYLQIWATESEEYHTNDSSELRWMKMWLLNHIE